MADSWGDITPVVKWDDISPASTTAPIQPLAGTDSSNPINQPDAKVTQTLEPKKKGWWEEMSDSTKKFLNEHPHGRQFLQRILTGASDEDKQSMQAQGINPNFVGPGMMQIPGVQSVADKGTQSLTNAGHPWLGKGLSILGGAASEGFDPRTAGTESALQPIKYYLARRNTIIPQAGGDVLDTSKIAADKTGLSIESKPGLPAAKSTQFGIKATGATDNPILATVPDRLKPPSTNQTVFDALVPDSLKENVSATGQPAGRDIVPTVTPPQFDIAEKMGFKDIKPIEPKSTSGMSRWQKFWSDETGAIRFGQTDEQNDAVQKLLASLKENRGRMVEEETLQRAERAKRFSAFESAQSGAGEQGARMRMSELSGKYPWVNKERLKLDQTDIDTLFDAIDSSKNISTPERIRATDAMFDLISLRKKVPQRNQLDVLDKVFGKNLGENIVKMHGGLGLVDAGKYSIAELAGLMKSMMTFGHITAPLKQGMGLIHRPEWRAAIGDMLKSGISEDYFNNMIAHMESAESSVPGLQDFLNSRDTSLFGYLKDNGLSITDLNSLTNQEEAFGGRLASKIPLMKYNKQAFTGFLNKLRFDTAKNILENGVKMGLNPEEITEAGKSSLIKSTIDYVNNATGRGSLGSMERYAEPLNAALFSPRYLASRLTMLNPMYYAKMHPVVQKEAFKSLFAMASVMATTEGLAHTVGGQISLNPTSPDFLKPRFNHTRMDPLSGFQQPIVAATRLLTGYKTSVDPFGNETIHDLTSGKFGQDDRGDVALRFGRNKLSPMGTFLIDVFTGKDAGGNKIKPSQAALKSITPMALKAMYDIYKEDPDLLPLGALGLIGDTTQVYEPREKSENLTAPSIGSLKP